MTLASELMMVPPPQVVEDTPLSFCRSREKGHLIVLRADGSLRGVLTDAAMYRHEGGPDLTAGELCVSADVLVGPGEPLSSVISQLHETKQDLAVVVDGECRPLGLLTEHLLLQVAAVVLPFARKVAHLPRRPVWTIDRRQPAAAALRAMLRHRVRHLPVTGAGEVIGLVSYRDLLAATPEQRGSSVERLCTRPVALAEPGHALSECALRMLALGKGCLPVLRAGRAEQMVTRRDLLDAAAQELAGRTRAAG